eukprot:2081178-Rhodomonas_salina.4
MQLQGLREMMGTQGSGGAGAYSPLWKNEWGAAQVKETSLKPDEKVGILFLNLGGPETLDEVEDFLYNLFNDEDIIRLPNPLKPLQGGPLFFTLSLCSGLHAAHCRCGSRSSACQAFLMVLLHANETTCITALHALRSCNDDHGQASLREELRLVGRPTPATRMSPSVVVRPS